MKEKSRFIKILCPKCKKEQIIFGKATTKVKCISCSTLLVEPSGGKAKIKAKIEELL